MTSVRSMRSILRLPVRIRIFSTNDRGIGDKMILCSSPVLRIQIVPILRDHIDSKFVIHVVGYLMEDFKA